MEFFNVISVDEVKNILKENFSDLCINLEEVSILNCLDRILGEDIISDINVPEFNRSTVDGYAIKSSDSHGCSDSLPSFLDVAGEVNMGESIDTKIKSGQAVYVPTGGMIPEGADSVIMIEHVEKLDDITIAIHRPLFPGENVIYKGDDIKKREVILNKGKKITPQDIGVLASLGVGTVKVYKKPKFYIISTGDEIIDLDEELTLGKIRDINGYALYSLIEKLGGEIVNRVIVKDDYELLREEVDKALNTSNIILISGGSSVGTRDFTYDVINSFDGKGVLVHGVSIKPGKPTLIGEGKGKVIFGLPGHPVSSIIVFKIFVEYLVKEIIGINKEINKTKAIMDYNIHSSPGKETYQMVSLDERDGKLYAVPNFGKSGLITLLSKSCGYVVIKSEEEGLYKGQEVDMYFI
ncbi:molybdopterin molybdotransferase MoeA [Tepidibacter formicigenes]|jgi:molybdopterin molybdotransferase|uniref:Molybdopterin molybdenumtransferase n=1 Tax=Tepidibacter formicigenes DSM 15518 TaxID=1123349 RepID=A0A1M6QGI6_9FIRM|nr:molybdopterin molybdotransferase MoeA [Tepidibacter formicigenes]SHK19183.1 molybdopterin molybdotransferase [Tepidibacter formicigenes DSM 15518]